MKDPCQLLLVLQNQLDTCKKYLDIENKKTKVLMVGDIKKLDAIVRSEQSYIMKMESFENKREKILMENELNDITISEIITHHIDEKYKARFEDVFNQLTDIISEIEKVNFLNQKLLKQRLLVVNEIINNPIMSEYLLDGIEKKAKKGVSKLITNGNDRA